MKINLLLFLCVCFSSFCLAEVVDQPQVEWHTVKYADPYAPIMYDGCHMEVVLDDDTLWELYYDFSVDVGMQVGVYPMTGQETYKVHKLPRATHWMVKLHDGQRLPAYKYH